MQLGLFLPTASPFADADWLKAVATETEERGIDAIWIPEHVVQFDDYESRYPYSPDGKIPTGPNRGCSSPSRRSRSWRRLRLRSAWERRYVSWHSAIPSTPPRKRRTWTGSRRAGWISGSASVGSARSTRRSECPGRIAGRARRNASEVLKTLWCDDVSSYKGEFYDLPACSMYPKPVQHPHPPVHFGGESDAAISRAARIGQGWHTFGRLPADVPAVLETLDRELEGCGRTRAEFQVTVSPYLHPVDPAMVDQYAETGIDQLTLMLDGLLCRQTSQRPWTRSKPCFERARRS